MNRGVNPLTAAPWSLLAPASISKDTHLRLPLRDATHKDVIAFASSKLGFHGWFKCCLKKLVIILLTCHHDAGVSATRLRLQKLQHHKLYDLKGKFLIFDPGLIVTQLDSCCEAAAVGSRGCQAPAPIAFLTPYLRHLPIPHVQKQQLIHQSLQKALLAWDYCKKAPEVRNKSKYHISFVKRSRTKVVDWESCIFGTAAATTTTTTNNDNNT